MGAMQKTAIVIPCYNEEDRLNKEAFVSSSLSNPYLHFIFVNDGSTDKTGQTLDTICMTNPDRMKFITLEKNCGKAEAVRQGFLYAMKGNFTNIGYWDADLATPLKVIPQFCEKLDRGGVAMVMGSRVRLLGRNIQRRTVRHYLGRLFATVASGVLGLPVYDTQCGAKVFKNRAELAVVFGKPFLVKWIFDVEILARFMILERFTEITPLMDSAVEIPLEQWVDIPGSKISFGAFIFAAVELTKIWYFLRWPGSKRRYAELIEDLRS